MRLLDGPMAVGKLASDFPVSRPAISQHLKILKQANLVVDRAEGNRRFYQLNPDGFNSLREYFDTFWAQALAAFKKKIEEETMMTTMDPMLDAPVQRSVKVKASPERAFRAFTEGFDTWWPRSHHIGKSPMKKAIIEGRVGGRCYSEQVDNTECDWGRVLVWEPPRRFVFAWQIKPTWEYEPDLSKSSEVEVRFIPESDGSTRIDLEHRNFQRHGAGADAMRTGVSGEGGWGALLEMFAAHVDKT